MQATKEQVGQDGCISVNKNDFMSGMSFHNAQGFNINGQFDVNFTLKPDNKVTSFSASYDSEFDRLMF